ncbi:hypothetical protein O3G_MSEX010083 [Manduca sexta]|nr:hypothetical protein O3G_MSEX010083 [Manduca sexta]
MPLQYRKDVYKDGIQAGLYTPPESTFECADKNPDNKCYCQGESCPPRGLQNISPCQYNAPVYLSYPHFYDADPSLLAPFEGLNPDKQKHESYFLIQPKIGVPLEGFVRVQLNMKVDKAPNVYINSIDKFPNIIFPVMWLEEGIPEITTSIWRWIYLATTVGPVAAPLITYTLIVGGLLALAIIFVKAYKSVVIGQNSLEIVEIGRETLRRGSTLIHSTKMKQYQALKKQGRHQELTFVSSPELSRSLDEFRNMMRPDFVRSSFGDAEKESLIRSDNTFILSEHKRFEDS